MKGIKLVALVMAVMVVIGTMMTPAQADYETPATFEEKFEVLFDLYLEKAELEGYFRIVAFEDLEGDLYEDAHLAVVLFTDTAIEEIKNTNGIESDDVCAYAAVYVWDDLSYVIMAKLFVDGEEYDSDTLFGLNILEDFGLN